MAWKGESRKHSLARKGIKVANGQSMHQQKEPAIHNQLDVNNVSYRYDITRKGEYLIQAIDGEGNVIGNAYFVEQGNNIIISAGSILWVEPQWRRKGVARKMYEKAMEITGKQILPRHNLTPLGRAFQTGMGYDEK